MRDLDRYVRLMETVFPDPGEAPPLLRRARAVQLVLSGDDLEAAAVREEVPLFHLRRSDWNAVRFRGSSRRCTRRPIQDRTVYNPIARAVRERVPFLPLPVFTFEVWLGGLIVAVCALVLLSPFAFRGARWMAPLVYAFGVLMMGNGLAPLAGSWYLDRWMPGATSAPLLMAASTWLLWRVHGRGGASAPSP